MPGRMDPELPPLPPGLDGLKGIELLRAAYEATRPRTSERTTPRPFVAPRPPGRPGKATPAWTPHDAATEPPTVAHWADDIPLPEEPPEEEWR